jgi:hypothetical protein
MGHLYIAQVPSGAVKIGRTGGPPEKRVSQLRYRGERARLCASRPETIGPAGPGYGDEYHLHRGPIAADRIDEKRGYVPREWYWPSARVADLARSWGGAIEMPIGAGFLGAGI